MAGRVTRSPAERFWSMVDVRGGDECWPWTAAVRGHGYGAFSVKSGPEPKKRISIDAHRFAWELGHAEPIPEGMLVCHHCDNPPCCNPAHLFVGTYADNNWDKTDKGRNPGNRLTTGRKQHELRGDKLNEALRLLALGWTQRQVAHHFGLSPAAVCRGLKAAAPFPGPPVSVETTLL